MKEINKNQAIDIEFLRSIIENDFEFEKELFAIFSENATRNVTKMEDAIKSGDSNSWYMSSHAFKGASASIGAFQLSNILEYAQKQYLIEKDIHVVNLNVRVIKQLNLKKHLKIENNYIKLLYE